MIIFDEEKIPFCQSVIVGKSKRHNRISFNIFREILIRTLSSLCSISKGKLRVIADIKDVRGERSTD